MGQHLSKLRNKFMSLKINTKSQSNKNTSNALQSDFEQNCNDSPLNALLAIQQKMLDGSRYPKTARFHPNIQKKENRIDYDKLQNFYFENMHKLKEQGIYQQKELQRQKKQTIYKEQLKILKDKLQNITFHSNNIYKNFVNKCKNKGDNIISKFKWSKAAQSIGLDSLNNFNTKNSLKMNLDNNHISQIDLTDKKQVDDYMQSLKPKEFQPTDIEKVKRYLSALIQKGQQDNILDLPYDVKTMDAIYQKHLQHTLNLSEMQQIFEALLKIDDEKHISLAVSLLGHSASKLDIPYMQTKIKPLFEQGGAFYLDTALPDLFANDILLSWMMGNKRDGVSIRDDIILQWALNNHQNNTAFHQMAILAFINRTYDGDTLGMNYQGFTEKMFKLCEDIVYRTLSKQFQSNSNANALKIPACLRFGDFLACLSDVKDSHKQTYSRVSAFIENNLALFDKSDFEDALELLNSDDQNRLICLQQTHLLQTQIGQLEAKIRKEEDFYQHVDLHMEQQQLKHEQNSIDAMNQPFEKAKTQTTQSDVEFNFSHKLKQSPFRFEIVYQSKKSSARIGRLHTSHGHVDTPCFVGVGTNAAMKHLSPQLVESIGLQLMFANTYHLMLQPGTEVIKKAGGIHKFMNRQSPIITDSGGFQVFSLQYGGVHRELTQQKGQPLPSSILDQSNQNDAQKIKKQQNNSTNLVCKVNEEGVLFRSYRTGEKLLLTPESSIQAQKDIGADIMIAFDELPPYHIEPKRLKECFDRTHRWARRSLDAHLSTPSPFNFHQALFGVVHGGLDKELRQASARQLMNMEKFDGFALGGSVGKNMLEMEQLLNYMKGTLFDVQQVKPVHLLGIGDLPSIHLAIPFGIDSFDSAYPTILARHGSVLTHEGKLKLTSLAHQNSFFPIDKHCMCYTCINYDRAYLNHLFKANEASALALASIHNLHFMGEKMKEYRNMIMNDQI